MKAFNAAMSYALKNVIKATYPSFTIDYTQAMVSKYWQYQQFKSTRIRPMDEPTGIT